jgi:translation initiation factor 2 alpha subunit (eIF-2alpha)
MKQLKERTKEIYDLTLRIEQEYPELYQYLDENPMTIPSSEHPELNTKIFSDWLDSLKELLKHHIENHQN